MSARGDMSPDTHPLLEIRDLRVSYGGVEALHGLCLKVMEGELVTILGANGAGKSTTLMAISGLVRPKSGEILFRGERLDLLRSHEVVKLGVTQAPEGRRVFGPMSVEENLKLGAFTRQGQASIAKGLSRIYGLFPRLEERRGQMAGTLSGGEQQMLAIGRALMAEPSLLLLDEPSLGLAPLLVRSIFETIKGINQSGVTVILVEQNARAALKLADRGYVLDVGHLVLEDRAEKLLDNPQVRDAYLGSR
jgi:branched-chain amino acid transport system ATP-binding protein